MKYYRYRYNCEITKIEETIDDIGDKIYYIYKITYGEWVKQFALRSIHDYIELTEEEAFLEMV
ncbi:MAG: hypothetical protein KAS32_22630 [Candidatus Peribacteraceae bacterium]|nr:hypothetical protein [Candidatus Peribacteraceae bacterium]